MAESLSIKEASGSLGFLKLDVVRLQPSLFIVNMKIRFAEFWIIFNPFFVQ